MGGKADIIRLPDGRIQINVDGELTVEQAAAISEGLFQRLGMRVPIAVDGGPEQHKPDVRHAHVVSHGRVGHGG